MGGTKHANVQAFGSKKVVSAEKPADVQEASSDLFIQGQVAREKCRFAVIFLATDSPALKPARLLEFTKSEF
jgi:hypothetical protein